MDLSDSFSLARPGVARRDRWLGLGYRHTSFSPRRDRFTHTFLRSTRTHRRSGLPPLASCSFIVAVSEAHARWNTRVSRTHSGARADPVHAHACTELHRVLPLSCRYLSRSFHTRETDVYTPRGARLCSCIASEISLMRCSNGLANRAARRRSITIDN